MQPTSHTNPSLSLGESLVSSVYFGDETLTLRMGEKYHDGRYQKGPVEFVVTDTNFSITSEITDVNEKGKRIATLTADEMRRNGYFLPENPTKEQLQETRRCVLESMQQWYPNETFQGLNTKVFPLAFQSPEQTADLRRMRKVLFQLLHTQLQARYYPSYAKDNPQVDMFVIDF